MNSRLLLLPLGIVLAATAVHAQLLNETFTYSAGDLTTASSGAWVAHSSVASNPVQVSGSGAASLTGGSGAREDVNRSIGTSFSDGTVWASFTLDLSGGTIAANGVSSYFLHFSNGGTSNFRGRVFLGSAGDTSLFKLGIENDAVDGDATVSFSGNLDRSTPHSVSVAYDLDTRTSKLWVDTATSNSPTVQDTVAATAAAVSAVALRQGGTATTGAFSGLQIDNLVVTHTAVPEPHEWAAVAGVGLMAFAIWRRRR